MPVKATKSGITRYWDNAQWDAMDGSHNGWTLIERIDVEKPEARRPFAEIAPPRVIPVGDPLYGVEGESPIVVTNDLGIATVSLIDGTVDGYVLTWNDSGGYWEEQAPPTGVPPGTDTQTLRYNGTTLEANSLLRNDGSQIGVNTAPASGILLKLKQASTGDGIAVERSSSAGQIRMYHGSAGIIDTTLNNLELKSAGQLNLYGAGGGGFITQVLVGAQANITSVFGNSGLMRFSGTYAPTASGGDFAFLKFLPEVNQTGSANQDVAAIDLNPTLTSVLGTFTGVNYRPSAYRFLWQPNGAGVTSHLRGVLGIGESTTIPAQTLHVNGTMRLTGSDGTATALMGRDADGDVSAVTVGSGLTLSGGEITADAAGTVTSVGLDMPAAVFDVSGSPVTSSGTITVTLDTQTENTVWAGPATGPAAAPTFRALVLADLPAGYDDNQTITLSGDVTGSGTTSITTNISADTVGPTELIDTAVSPGSYTAANITVDAQGRITAASNGSVGVGGSGSGLANRVAYWVSTTNISADDDFSFNGTQIGMGTTTLTDRLNLDGNTRFYNGQFKFGRYSGTVPTAYATVQIEGKASGISLPSTPAEDAALIIRGRSSGGTVYDQSLHFGIDTNSNYGTFIQARSHDDYNEFHTIRINPRGGRVSVGRLTSTANTAVMTVFASSFGASGAGPYLLNLESSEGTAKLGFSTGTDLVHSSQWYDGVNLIMRTSNLRSESFASIRWSIGSSETADKMILMPNSNGRLGVGYSSTSGIHSTVQSAGSFSGAILETVGAPTFDETKNVVVYTNTANVTWTLPAASSCAGRRYVLHHANSSGTITLSPSITKGNGGNFNTLSAGEWAWVISTGSGWRGYKFTSS